MLRLGGHCMLRRIHSAVFPWINETDKTEPSTEILYKDWDNKRNCMRLLLFTVEKDSINRHGEKAKLR